MIRALFLGAGIGLLAAAAPVRADIVPPADDSMQIESAPPGVLDGSWRVVADDKAEVPIVTLDIAHAADEARAAGVFTALPGLCPSVAAGGDCEWDGISGEVTDIVLTDTGVLISFNPSADADDEQNLRLAPQPDGSWTGTLDGRPARQVKMSRPPE
jgi:hypothetical protein